MRLLRRGHGQHDDVFVQHLVVAQIVRERRRCAGRLRGHEDRGARHARRLCTRDTMAMNSSSGIARAVSRSATSRRPVFHVVISVNSATATTSVHPAALHDLQRVGAEERDVDGQEHRHRRAIADGFGQCHRSVITTYSSSTVMIIVSVTAMP